MEIRDIVAPNLDKQREVHDFLREYSYYFIITIISLIVMFVVPILTGCLYGDLSLAFPDTTEEWILFLIIRLGISLTNVAIFVLFKLQAVTNVRTNEKYVAACNKLNQTIRQKRWVPKSPKEMNRKDYLVKGTTLFITSIIAMVTISSLVIDFDLITFISCLLTAIMSIVFGWTTMLKNEVYWVDEFPLWVDYISQEENHD